MEEMEGRRNEKESRNGMNGLNRSMSKEEYDRFSLDLSERSSEQF